jgi:hypothetical protein
MSREMRDSLAGVGIRVISMHLRQKPLRISVASGMSSVFARRISSST